MTTPHVLYKIIWVKVPGVWPWSATIAQRNHFLIILLYNFFPCVLLCSVMLIKKTMTFWMPRLVVCVFRFISVLIHIVGVTFMMYILLLSTLNRIYRSTGGFLTHIYPSALSILRQSFSERQRVIVRENYRQSHCQIQLYTESLKRECTNVWLDLTWNCNQPCMSYKVNQEGWPISFSGSLLSHATNHG